MRIPLTTVIFLLCLSSAIAAPLPSESRAEVDALLSRLETSGCEFNRNGSWHTGAEAKTHILRKLEYLEDKGAVHSTEQVIELAAASSSMTGQAYQVRCGKDAPVPSKTWLLSQLKALRASSEP
jgi:hypothetical protein